jgi:hypothetical protein
MIAVRTIRSTGTLLRDSILREGGWEPGVENALAVSAPTGALSAK